LNVKNASSLMFVGLGIFAGLMAVAILQSAFMSFTYRPGTGPLRVLLPVALFMPFMILVWLATRLIRNRERYTDLLFPDPDAESSTVGAREIYVIALSLIGLYLVATAIPDLARWGVTLLTSNLQGAGSHSGTPASGGYAVVVAPPPIGELAAAIIQAAVGVCFVAYRSRITAFLLHERVEAPAKESEELYCPSCGYPYDPSDYVAGETPALCLKCRTPLPGLGV
jgi:hypothetical protein